METTPQISPWTLPKLQVPDALKPPTKRGRYNNKHNGLHPINTGRATIHGLSKASDARLKNIPSRDSINTVQTLQRDKTDKIRRGGI